MGLLDRFYIVSFIALILARISATEDRSSGVVGVVVLVLFIVVSIAFVSGAKGL